MLGVVSFSGPACLLWVAALSVISCVGAVCVLCGYALLVFERSQCI